MKVLNVHEAKTRLSAILTEIESTGEEVILCRNGKPVARLSPLSPRDRLQPHPIMSRIEVRYDPTEPLAPDEWAGER